MLYYGYNFLYCGDPEKEKILSDLVEYCGLDTLAMVEIYRKLSEL